MIDAFFHYRLISLIMLTNLWHLVSSILCHSSEDIYATVLLHNFPRKAHRPYISASYTNLTLQRNTTLMPRCYTTSIFFVTAYSLQDALVKFILNIMLQMIRWYL